MRSAPTTETSEAARRSSSAGSIALTPARTTSRSTTGVKPGTPLAISFQQCPTATARPISSVKPVVVSGVLKSAWASNHTTPRSAASRPAIVPTAVLQFPESTRGNAPSATASRTCSATRRSSSKAVATSAGGFLRLVGACPQPAGDVDKRFVARRSLAVGPIPGVLEADAGVDAPANRVGEQHPGGLPVAVLQPRGCEAELVQRSVDVFDQPDCVLGGGFNGLDQDPREPSAQPGCPKPLGVLDAPHARLDADPGPDQNLHELRRAGLGEVD